MYKQVGSSMVSHRFSNCEPSTSNTNSFEITGTIPTAEDEIDFIYYSPDTSNEYSFGSSSSEDINHDIDFGISYALARCSDDDSIIIENAIDTLKETKPKRFKWVESIWNSFDELIAFLQGNNFSQYDYKNLAKGDKYYFRCNKVPKRNNIWCNKRYNIYLPADSTDVILCDNGQEHTHDQICTNDPRGTKLSPQMVGFLKDLYANKTTSYDVVINHIELARKTRSMFLDEKNPSYRQHEYQLKKFRETALKPVVSVGDIAEFCESNQLFPPSPDDPFILNYETSNIHQNMFFRFCITTPHLLKQISTLQNFCIDATYKLNWMGFPLVVFGTVDRMKCFHPLLYGCTTNETTDDYRFIFKSIKEGVEKYFGTQLDAKILIADGDRAIGNAFMDIFPNFEKVIMCYAHVVRNINKRPFTSTNNKRLILDDIYYMHLASNRETFDKMSELFLKKWQDIETDFITYFQQQWLDACSNWFEGAAVYFPSHNNGVESHNSNIKRNWTFRKRLPLNQFFIAMCEMTTAASKKSSSGDRKIAKEPTIKKVMLKKAAELEINNFKFFIARKQKNKDHTVFLIPSESCKENEATRQFYKNIQKKSWQSFDEYIEHGFNKFYVVSLSMDNWKTNSQCLCPSFYKQNICKHIIALAIRSKLFELPQSVNPTKLSAKQKPGRKPNALRALLIQ